MADIGGAILGAGSGLLNGGMQMLTNWQQQQYNTNMYNRQRSDALSDWNRQNAYNMDMWNMNNQYNAQLWDKQNAYNLQMWNLQNAYNSPEAQMERYKKAGINPAAVFGNMGGGGVSMDASQLVHSSAPDGGSIRSSSAGSYNPQAPRLGFDMVNGLLAHQDIQQKSAQTDNLREQNEVLKRQADQITAQTAGTLAETGYKRLSTDLLRSTFQGQVDAVDLNNRRTRLGMYIDSKANERQEKSFPNTFELLRQQVQNARLDGRLKVSTWEAQQIEKDLHRLQLQDYQQGIHPNDGYLIRTFGKAATKPLYEGGASLLDAFKMITGDYSGMDK